MQLNDLGINVLYDFIDYDENDKVPQFKQNEEKYKYLHLPFNKDVAIDIDFDVINASIDEAMKPCQENGEVQNKKVLLYCKDGQTISTAFAISYLMHKANLNIQMATLKVCQAISRVEVNKWMYSQLLVYKPKK